MKRVSRVVRSIWSRRAAVVAVAAAILVVSVAVPAFGGPRAVSAVNAVKLAKKALKKANQADKRSKQALAEAQKVGSQTTPGARGQQGPAGAPGAAGAAGRDGFGALSYAVGPGHTRSTVGYVSDVAHCPAGQAPTGGSVVYLSGAETGGPNAGGPTDFGDAGDGAVDDSNPLDGKIDSWLVYVYNGAGSAEIVAGVVCAPAGSTVVVQALRAGTDKRAEGIRSLLKGQ